MLTTNQAASLIDVHPSTIKRWCNDEDLPCSFTPGGHRRIDLDVLLEFAQDRDFHSPLLDLHPHHRRAWKGLEEARRNERYDVLVALAYDVLVDEPAPRFVQYLRFLREQDLNLEILFDHVLTPALQKIGERWYSGDLGIGDEHRITHLVRDSLVQLVERPLNYGTTSPVALVGTSRNEQHEIGALMTRLILEQHGWTVIYLGIDVPYEEFAFQQQKRDATLVCVSFTSLRGGMTEMRRLMQVLAPFYDSGSPYRLALGGAVVSSVDELSLSHYPFLDVEVFESICPFQQWVASFSPP